MARSGLVFCSTVRGQSRVTGAGLEFCSRHSAASCFKFDVAVTLFSSYVSNEEVMQQIASGIKDVGLLVDYYQMICHCDYDRNLKT